MLSLLFLIVIAAGLCGAGGIVGAFAGRLTSAQIVTAFVGGGFSWLIFWLAATLLFGRIYCSTVCPAGTAMDIVSRVSSRRLRGIPERYRYRQGSTAVRIVALIVLVESLAFGSATLTSFLDPYADFARLFTVWGSMTATSLIAAGTVAGIALAMSWRGGRSLCNTFCPVGAALGAITPLSLLRFDINPDLCTHCGTCERVCKSSCVNSDRSLVDNTRCVVCFDCVSVCPNSAITWRRGRHRLQWPLLQKTTQATAPSAPATASAPQTLSEMAEKESDKRNCRG